MGWVPHEAHSETRIQGQVVYSGDDSRKHSREDGKGDTERKRANKGHVASKLLLWATGAQHPWGRGALAGCREQAPCYLHGRRGSWDIHLPTGGAVSRDRKSLQLLGHPACWPVPPTARTKPSFRGSQV